MTTAQDCGKVVSLTHRPPLPPRKCSWYSFLLEAESTPGPQCDRKDFMSMKYSNDTSYCQKIHDGYPTSTTGEELQARTLHPDRHRMVLLIRSVAYHNNLSNHIQIFSVLTCPFMGGGTFLRLRRPAVCMTKSIHIAVRRWKQIADMN